MKDPDQEALPEDVRKQLLRVTGALDKLERVINGTLNTPFHQIDNELSPLQRATHYLNLARAVYYSYQLLLRTQGMSPGKKHPLLAEADRLKAYGKKVRKLESAEYLALHKPATEINIAAANRFINHAIPDLSKEQKAALKQVGNKRKEPSPTPSTSSSAELARAFLEQTLGSPAKKAK